MTCENGAGSLNNPANVPPLTPYQPTDPCIGTWQISGEDDLCARNEAALQEGYAAENININGAPLNIYKLLGVHEQGDGSLLNKGIMMASQAEPGYPLSGVNTGGAWHSIQMGSAVVGAAFIGVDFGIALAKPSTLPANSPPKPAWQKVGAITIKQGNTAFNYARQVKVEIADGSTTVAAPSFVGVGNGTMTGVAVGPNAIGARVSVIAMSSTQFQVSALTTMGQSVSLGVATVGLPFNSTLISFQINAGATPFSVGDTFAINIDYIWKRAGVYNLTQTNQSTTLNLHHELLAKAVRVVPTMFSGTDHWEVLELDVLDSSPTDINNIQDLFFQENRDRDYATTPIRIKAQYSINDSISDLSKFGLNILDQYSFVVSFPVMVSLLGRPLVTGDIIEVIPEMQYDHNLLPIRKFLEVTDTGWASAGYSTAWKPSLFRFQAQEAIPSQETRDIFGTMDTLKYLTADSVLSDGVGEQVEIGALTVTEETIKEAAKAVPETGSDDQLSTLGSPVPVAIPNVNEKGQPTPVNAKYKANVYIEDGLPKNGEPYLEGYQLPDTATAVDGQFYRLNYAESTDIAPRLYRFSAVKGRWIFMEQDKRGQYTSAKPSIHKILNSPTKVGLGKKQP